MVTSFTCLRTSYFRNCYGTTTLPMQEALRNFKNFLKYQLFKSICRILHANCPLLNSTRVGCKAKILPLKNRPSFNFASICSALGGTQVCIYRTLAELFRTVQVIAFSKLASFVTHLSNGGDNFSILSRNGLTRTNSA